MKRGRQGNKKGQYDGGQCDRRGQYDRGAV